MKNSSFSPTSYRLVLMFFLLLLALVVYFGNFLNLTIQDPSESEKTTGRVFEEGFASSNTDLVETYTKLYGKYQVKAFSNYRFSIPTESEVETLRSEAYALDQLYFKMTAKDRRKIKRASFPYAKLEVAGKVRYKRFEDLTQQERESLNC